MKKYGLDKKTLTQVSTAVNQYSSFGIENTTFKTDYIHLYVMDMNDNVLAEQYLSQDEVNIIDNSVVDINVGVHLRQMGFTEGDYKVKYYFLSSLAGLPSIANNVGEEGYIYLTEDQRKFYGKVTTKIVNNEEKYCYYNTDGTTEIPLKRVENKYVLMKVNSDRTEVKTDTQNIDNYTYIDTYRTLLRQKAYPRYNWNGSYKSYHYSDAYPSPKIKFD